VRKLLTTYILRVAEHGGKQRRWTNYKGAARGLKVSAHRAFEQQRRGCNR